MSATAGPYHAQRGDAPVSTFAVSQERLDDSGRITEVRWGQPAPRHPA